jgi:hypothetical protein
VISVSCRAVVGRYQHHQLSRRLFEGLPTSQVVVMDGPHPPVELEAIAARPEPAWSSPAVPPRARSIGRSRSPTDNSGRSHPGPDLPIGLAPGRDDGTGRAIQGRDLVGPHRSHELPDRSGQHRSYRSASPQFTRRTPPGAANPRETPATVPLVPVAHCERDDLVVGSLPIRADWRGRGPP